VDDIAAVQHTADTQRFLEGLHALCDRIRHTPGERQPIVVAMIAVGLLVLDGDSVNPKDISKPGAAVDALARLDSDGTVGLQATITVASRKVLIIQRDRRVLCIYVLL
jgi:hypothetical protein